MTIMTIYLINRYAKWKERSKLSQQEDRDNDQEDEAEAGPRGHKRPSTALPASHPAMKKARTAVRIGRKNKNEIKRPEQILKKRTEDERREARKARGGGRGGGRGRGRGRGGRRC